MRAANAEPGVFDIGLAEAAGPGILSDTLPVKVTSHRFVSPSNKRVLRKNHVAFDTTATRGSSEERPTRMDRRSAVTEQ